MMKKILLSLALVLSMCIIPVNAEVSSNNIDIHSKYGCALDFTTGEILCYKNAKKKMYPASMTKVMTAIVAIEKLEEDGIDLDTKVKIKGRDLKTVYETGASACYLQKGEKVSYMNLLYGCLIQSGADACRALAFNTYGSQKAFVKAMNKKAKELGCDSTHFVNVTGIHSKKHYTTAYDMAVITRYACQNDTFREAFGGKNYLMCNGHYWHKKAYYRAKAAYKDLGDKILGCKSGWTVKAKTCLATLLKVKGHKVVCVTAYGNQNKTSNIAAKDLKLFEKYIKNHYKLVKAVKKGDAVETVDIKYAKEDTYDLTYNTTVSMFLPNSYDKDKLKVKNTIETIYAPVKAGKEVGTTTISYNGKKLCTSPLVITEDFERDTFNFIQDSVCDLMMPYGICVLVAAVLVLTVVIKKVRKKKE